MNIRVLAVTLLLCMSAVCYAQPVEIKSDSLVVEHQLSRAQFDRNVWLKREDFELRCDRLVVRYKQEMGGEVEQAEAYGHVTMKQGEKRGSSNEAVYQQAAGMLTLIGNAKVESPDGLIQGEKVLHNINTKKTTVLQGADGGRARFMIEEEDLDRKAKDSKQSVEKGAP